MVLLDHRAVGVAGVAHRVPDPGSSEGRTSSHDRGFVIAPNHISAIDPVFVVIARFWGRPMVIMAKEELFEISRLLNWGLAACGRRLCAPGKGRRHSGGKHCARGA